MKFTLEIDLTNLSPAHLVKALREVAKTVKTRSEFILETRAVTIYTPAQQMVGEWRIMQRPHSFWELINDYKDYKDYEPSSTVGIDGLARVTFVMNQHMAYATKANPKATLDNDEELAIDEHVNLTWEEAERLVGQKVVSAPAPVPAPSRNLGGYADLIDEFIPGQSEERLAEIEETMRQDIFHSTLDWQTREQLREAALEADQILKALGK